jgi:endonuclease YncB( thermonuclease family)
VPNTLAPPPTQWVPAASEAKAPGPAQNPGGDWAAPAAIGGATAAAMQPSAAPVAAAAPPPTGPAPQLQPLSPPPTVPLAQHSWRVVGVYDGDSVTCLDEAGQQQQVRLAGIDAPESSQAYGRESREALAGMVFGRTVEVLDAGRDANGALIGRLSVDGQDVNRQMVATGNAWADPSAVDPTLATAQTAAQASRLGLWAQPDPTPPWNER